METVMDVTPTNFKDICWYNFYENPKTKSI